MMSVLCIVTRLDAVLWQMFQAWCDVFLVSTGYEDFDQARTFWSGTA